MFSTSPIAPQIELSLMAETTYSMSPFVKLRYESSVFTAVAAVVVAKASAFSIGVIARISASSVVRVD